MISVVSLIFLVVLGLCIVFLFWRKGRSGPSRGMPTWFRIGCAVVGVGGLATLVWTHHNEMTNVFSKTENPKDLRVKVPVPEGNASAPQATKLLVTAIYGDGKDSGSPVGVKQWEFDSVKDANKNNWRSFAVGPYALNTKIWFSPISKFEEIEKDGEKRFQAGFRRKIRTGGWRGKPTKKVDPNQRTNFSFGTSGSGRLEVDGKAMRGSESSISISPGLRNLGWGMSMSSTRKSHVAIYMALVRSDTPLKSVPVQEFLKEVEQSNRQQDPFYLNHRYLDSENPRGFAMLEFFGLPVVVLLFSCLFLIQILPRYKTIGLLVVVFGGILLMSALEKQSLERGVAMVSDSSNSIAIRKTMARNVGRSFFWRSSAMKTLEKIQRDRGEPEELRSHIQTVLDSIEQHR